MGTRTAHQIPTPPVDARRAILRLVWFTMRFAIFGPIAGYLAMWFFATIVMFPWNAAKDGVDQALSLPVISLLGFFLFVFPVVLAYALAIVPAALTGFLAGILSLVTPHPLVYYSGTAFAGWITTFMTIQNYTQWDSISHAQYGLVGATAGLICAWRARRRMHLGPKIYGIPVTL